MINTSRDHMFAYVSPRSIGGESLFSPTAKLDTEHIRGFLSEKRTVKAAASKLESMGFEIVSISELAIKISGSSDLFQRRMGVRFQRDQSSMYLPTPETTMNALQLGSEVLEGAVFPQPIELHARKRAAVEIAAASKKTLPGKAGKAAKKPAKKVPVKTLTGGISGTAPSLAYYHLNVPDDIVRLMNAAPVHAQGTRGRGVRVGMIDSGFAWSHPYFQGKGYNLNVDAPDDSDAEGHGTGESANLLAIAPKAKMYGLGMDDAVASFQRARNQLKLKVLSNSWGSRLPTDGPFSSWAPYWSLVLAEISLCVQAGMVVLFSGGNGQMSVTASSKDVISVGGVYCNAAGQLEASNYASSFNSFRFPGRQVPDVCGLCGQKPEAIYIALPIPPGCEIDKDLSGGAFPDGDQTRRDDGWGVFSGTSAACPMVAGVVALMLSKYPDLTLAEIRQRLQSSCRDVTAGQSAMGDVAGIGRDLATGYGLVDAEAACR